MRVLGSKVLGLSQSKSSRQVFHSTNESLLAASSVSGRGAQSEDREKHTSGAKEAAEKGTCGVARSAGAEARR